MIEVEQNAFLLHSRPFRDNQVIAEFLTEFNGKISAITYIGTSIKSNKKALLQPFYPVIIVLKGQGNLKNLSRIEARAKSFILVKEYLYSGFYLNELQVRLLGEHIPYDELYNLYQQSLLELSEKLSIEPILRRFENTLLEELGLSIDYSLIFEQNETHFYYLPEQGFIPVTEEPSKACYEKTHLIAIAQQKFSEQTVMQTYKKLMRQVLNHVLGGKPLNSRKLFTKR